MDTSRDLQHLVLEARVKALEVIRLCASMGVEVLVTCTYRSPEEQARIYRRSRTRGEIEQKAQRLERRGFPFLGEILMGVGPQRGILGRHRTKAGPGESFHPLREALDVVPLIGGKPEWDEDAEEWQIYGTCCREVGLRWAGDWKGFPEFPHAQLSQSSNPLNAMTPDQVEDRMAWVRSQL